MNQVIGPRIAIVNGERTYLAGCSNITCELQCLRKDPQLVTRELHHPSNGQCTAFIQAGAKHRPDCTCSDCWHRRIPTSRAAYNHQLRGLDSVERERGIQRAEREFEDRMFRGRG